MILWSTSNLFQQVTSGKYYLWQLKIWATIKPQHITSMMSVVPRTSPIMCGAKSFVSIVRSRLLIGQRVWDKQANFEGVKQGLGISCHRMQQWGISKRSKWYLFLFLFVFTNSRSRKIHIIKGQSFSTIRIVILFSNERRHRPSFIFLRRYGMTPLMDPFQMRIIKSVFNSSMLTVWKVFS